MINFEESPFVIHILGWILVEYQLWQIVFSGENKFVDLASLMTRSPNSWTIAKEASIFHLLLLSHLLKMQTKENIFMIVNHSIVISVRKSFLNIFSVIYIISFFFHMFQTSLFINEYPESRV